MDRAGNRQAGMILNARLSDHIRVVVRTRLLLQQRKLCRLHRSHRTRNRFEGQIGFHLNVTGLSGAFGQFGIQFRAKAEKGKSVFIVGGQSHQHGQREVVFGPFVFGRFFFRISLRLLAHAYDRNHLRYSGGRNCARPLVFGNRSPAPAYAVNVNTG
mgnify:CR=1 FL=1